VERDQVLHHREAQPQPERDLPPEQIVPLNATGTGPPTVLFAGIHGPGLSSASDSFVAFTITITRMGWGPFSVVAGRLSRRLIRTTNDVWRDRHPRFRQKPST